MVHSYLATLLALSDALETACPAVGGPHQQRLGRLRTRLSFDSNKEAIEAGAALVRAELQDFANKSAAHITATSGEWKKAAEGICNLGAGIIRKQRFYGNRLRSMASKLDPDPAAALSSCAESMDTDAQSMLAAMQEILRGVEARLAQAEVVDSATGVMNRREIERRIEQQQTEGELGIRLIYRLTLDPTPKSTGPVLRQVAARLAAQLRPEDLIARWSESEFLVLFRSTAEIADRRSKQVAELLNGSYPCDGVMIDVRASVTQLDHELAETLAG